MYGITENFDEVTLLILEAKMKNHLTAGQAAEVLGVSAPTLINWDKKGRYRPSITLESGHRRYDADEVRELAAALTRVEELLKAFRARRKGTRVSD